MPKAVSVTGYAWLTKSNGEQGRYLPSSGGQSQEIVSQEQDSEPIDSEPSDSEPEIASQEIASQEIARLEMMVQYSKVKAMISLGIEAC